MDKTIDNWSRRAFYLVIAILMTLGLLLAPAMTPQASAAEVNAEWDKVGTPYTDDWTVAPGSDIVVGAAIPGGTVIYVVGSGWDDNEIGNSSDYSARLWKSEDSGVTWDDLADNVWDAEGLEGAGFDSSNSYFNYVACALDDSDFVAVAIVNTNSTSTYCDDEQAVVISDDGGDNFAWTGDIIDGAATLNCAFDMKVSYEADDKHNIALGGVGTNGTCPRGLVFRYETGGLTGGRWVDASAYDGWDDDGGITSVAVTKIAFAPSWLADNTVLALSHTNTSTYLQSGTWGNSKCWNDDAGFEDAVQIIGADGGMWSAFRGAAAGLALPTDYEGRHANTRYAWVYVDNDVNGTGVIYRVVNGDAHILGPMGQISDNPWLASLSYLGTIDEGKAIAGLLIGEGGCKGVQVYRNDGISDMDICCERWSEACKPPTGAKNAMVAYVAPNKAVALTAGDATDPFGFDESAFSFSLDDGDTWNQLGLVDTYIDYLSDVAKSPNCNKTWVFSVNFGGMRNGSYGCDSVWLKADPLPEASEYSGAWIREWCGELEGYDIGMSYYETGLIRLAPEETEEALTVYLVDRGTNTVYYDGTEGLGCWETGSSTVDEISDLAVLDEATIYAVGLYNDDVAVSDDHGAAASWSSTMDSKVDDGSTIAVLGEGNVLVGGTDGKVSYSDDDLETFLDGDASFTELDDIGEGNVHVAFDSYFDSNSVVYAAVAVTVDPFSYAGVGHDDNGIYRWVIDESTSWTDLGECTGTATPTRAQIGYMDDDGDLDPSCTRVEVAYTGILLSYAEGNPETDATTGGVLYATYGWFDNATETVYTGVARCLNPAEEVACGEAMWDYLIQGLSAENPEFFASSFKLCGCLTPDTHTKLYAIDWLSWYYGDVRNLTWWGGAPEFATGDEESGLGRLWTYEDCYAKAGPAILSPANDAVVDADPCYCWNDAFTLKWDRQCDACSYNLQISLDEDFTEVVVDWSGKNDDCTENDYDPPKGSAPSYVVANGALGTGSCGTTFYWRVRSADAETDEIIHSPWSEVRSFTVAVGPMAALTLTNPSNGAIGVAVSNIPFTWDAVADATGYEFSLVNAATDAEVVSATAVSGTTYTYTGTLSYDTSYLWTVKAFKDTTAFGDATATFTTGKEGVVPPAPSTPAWVWVIIAIGALLVIVTMVLIFRTRRV